MSVHILLSTTLRDCVPEYAPQAGLLLDLPEPASAGELAAGLGLPLEQIKIVMVNGRHAGLEQMVHDGDRLAFFPAVGGG